MTLSFALTLTASLLGQGPSDPAGASDRLEIMKAAAAAYNILPADGAGGPFRLQPDPVLHFTNPLGATRDGAIFLWLSEDGRPAVAAQIFAHREGTWTHEFTSLSTAPIVGKVPGAPEWRPKKAYVEFKPIPGAPKPSGSPEQRLRQMQALARDFVVEDLFREKSWQRLRMLTKPFARYGKPGTEMVDGALFAFVLTTDPEAFLMLEAREGKDGPAWHFALAPMTIYSLKASWKGRPAWEVPSRWLAASKPDQPFYFRERIAPVEGEKP